MGGMLGGEIAQHLLALAREQVALEQARALGLGAGRARRSDN